MIRIKKHSFISLCSIFIAPIPCIIFATFVLILELIDGSIGEQSRVIIPIIYYVSIGLVPTSFLIRFIYLKVTKNEIFIDENTIFFDSKIYNIEQIESCEYCVCRWYKVPFVLWLEYFSLSNSGGLMSIEFKNKDMLTLMFRVSFKDYLKIKPYLKNIVEV